MKTFGTLEYAIDKYSGSWTWEITGVQVQYPKANQSVIQKAKYEGKKFECKKDNT